MAMLTDYECIDGAVECSTLTPEQAAGCMRYAGVKISIETLRNGIEQGRFPFGFVIEQGQRTFVISRFKLEQWLAEFTGLTVSVEQVLHGVQNL